MTPKQKATLDAIRAYIAENDGVSPSVDDLAYALGGKSKSAIHAALGHLEAGGHISRAPGKARSIRILPTRETKLLEYIANAERAISGGNPNAARRELGLAKRLIDRA